METDETIIIMSSYVTLCSVVCQCLFLSLCLQCNVAFLLHDPSCILVCSRLATSNIKRSQTERNSLEPAAVVKSFTKQYLFKCNIYNLCSCLFVCLLLFLFALHCIHHGRRLHRHPTSERSLVPL